MCTSHFVGFVVRQLFFLDFDLVVYFQLKCGHVFHLHCAKMILEKKWTGPRITFGFSLCPICKVGKNCRDSDK